MGSVESGEGGAGGGRNNARLTSNHTISRRDGDADRSGVADDEVAAKLRVGTQVICMDQFPSKYTGKVMIKWRPAEIVDMVSA